jgi:hypothetical protein
MGWISSQEWGTRSTDFRGEVRCRLCSFEARCRRGSPIDLQRCTTAHPANSRVLMLKPRVGDTVLASSPLMRFTIVVLPALSSPLRWWRRKRRQRTESHDLPHKHPASPAAHALQAWLTLVTHESRAPGV